MTESANAPNEKVFAVYWTFRGGLIQYQVVASKELADEANNWIIEHVTRKTYEGPKLESVGIARATPVQSMACLKKAFLKDAAKNS